MVLTDCGALSRHKARWLDCRKCPLHKTRTQVVLFRGDVPCQVLFIGEAPGRMEDEIGLPFVGPSGNVLDEMLEHATRFLKFSYAITNLIACRPISDGNDRRPSKKELAACRPRLEEFIQLCQPNLLVLLGATAAEFVTAEHFPQIADVPVCRLVHPAYILRKGGDLSRDYQQAVVVLLSFLYENQQVLAEKVNL